MVSNLQFAAEIHPEKHDSSKNVLFRIEKN